MDLTDIERMYAEIRAKTKEFSDLVGQFEARKPEMEKELQAIEQELPRLLAGVVVGEVFRTEVTKIKKRKREIEEFLGDFPLVLKGVETFRARFTNEGRKISNLERKVQRFEALKQRFIEKPNLYYEKELFSEAEGLDRLDEAKKFLEDLRTKKPKN